MQNVNPIQMIQMLNDFRANFKGNPKEEMMKLVQRSGMPQSELNRLQNEATQLQKMINNMR